MRDSLQMSFSMKFLMVLVFLFSAFDATSADRDFSQVKIKTIKVTDHVYMLTGQGGNIGVSTGDDGVFLVDDQFAPLTEKILTAIKVISDQNVRFLINTHWHGDHVGGNENIGKAGAVIVAHENVRARLSTDQFVEYFDRKIPASPDIALPIITFTKDVTFHINNDDIHIFHVNNAHTDGDVIVYFKTSNVLHTGDVYFSNVYPFIDVGSKGSINGVIDALQHVLSLIDNDTKIIPGHGPLSNKAELSDYIQMLSKIRQEISKHIQAGKSLKKIQKARPTKKYDKKRNGGFISSDKFVEILYKDLSRETKD